MLNTRVLFRYSTSTFICNQSLLIYLTEKNEKLFSKYYHIIDLLKATDIILVFHLRQEATLTLRRLSSLLMTEGLLMLERGLV